MGRAWQPVMAVSVLVLAACGSSHRALSTLADAKRVAAVAPSSAGWTWPADNCPVQVSNAALDASSTDPLIARLARRTAKFRSSGDASKKWIDKDKLANVDVAAYADELDAHAELAPFNAFSTGMARRTSHVLSAAAVDGLGDEAWLLHAAGDNGREVTYHWRRGNLVLEAHIHCYGRCAPDIVAAARRWAEKLDAAAKA